MPIRSGKEVIPENSVMDAADDVADLLLGAEPKVAEETDAVERYPNVQFLTRVDEFPVTGSERFPIPEGATLIIPQAMFSTETDRRARNRAAADGPIFIPAQQQAPAAKEGSDEPLPQPQPGRRLTPQRAPQPGPGPQPAPGPAPTPRPPAPSPAPRPEPTPTPGQGPQPGSQSGPQVVAAPVYPAAKID